MRGSALPVLPASAIQEFLGKSAESRRIAPRRHSMDPSGHLDEHRQSVKPVLPGSTSYFDFALTSSTKPTTSPLATASLLNRSGWSNQSRMSRAGSSTAIPANSTAVSSFLVVPQCPGPATVGGGARALFVSPVVRHIEVGVRCSNWWGTRMASSPIRFSLGKERALHDESA